MRKAITEYILLVIGIILLSTLLNAFMHYNDTKMLKFSIPDDVFKYIFSVTFVFVFFIIKEKRKRSQNK